MPFEGVADNVMQQDNTKYDNFSNGSRKCLMYLKGSAAYGQIKALDTILEPQFYHVPKF